MMRYVLLSRRSALLLTDVQREAAFWGWIFFEAAGVVRVVVDLYSEAIQCLLLQQSRLLLRMFFKKNTLYTKFLECNDKILVMDFCMEKNYQIMPKKK